MRSFIPNITIIFRRRRYANCCRMPASPSWNWHCMRAGIPLYCRESPRTALSRCVKRCKRLQGERMNPTVSVLLPVYNGAAYLRESLESILGQTYPDFELISIGDPRIRFYRQRNRGLAATLNRAIELASGELLARQDQDDVSLPHRLEKQVGYLRSHTRCALVGTWAEILAVTEKTGRVHRHAEENHALQFDLLFDNP